MHMEVHSSHEPAKSPDSVSKLAPKSPMISDSYAIAKSTMLGFIFSKKWVH